MYKSRHRDYTGNAMELMADFILRAPTGSAGEIRRVHRASGTSLFQGQGRNKIMTTIERIKSHPAVQEISDERGSGDGFWAYLKPGLHLDNPGEHSIHEDTPSKVLTKLRSVKPCPCGCQSEADIPWEAR